MSSVLKHHQSVFTPIIQQFSVTLEDGHGDQMEQIRIKFHKVVLLYTAEDVVYTGLKHGQTQRKSPATSNFTVGQLLSDLILLLTLSLTLEYVHTHQGKQKLKLLL